MINEGYCRQRTTAATQQKYRAKLTQSKHEYSRRTPVSGFSKARPKPDHQNIPIWVEPPDSLQVFTSTGVFLCVRVESWHLNLAFL